MVTRIAPAFAILTAIFGAAAGMPAQAQDMKDLDHAYVANLVDTQGMISQRLAKEALLVALDVDKDRNLANLETSYRTFREALAGLRTGSDALGVTAVSNPTVMEDLDRAQRIWDQIDPVLRDCIANGRLTRDDIALIVELNGPLHDAVVEAAEAYADEVPASNHFSMLVVAIDLASRQRTLLQRMTKEFLVIAYDQDTAPSQSSLQESVDRFDTALTGLINGDLDQLLLPAPTEEIRSSLRRIERIWQDEFRPHLRVAIDGRRATPADIQQVARINQRMIIEFEAVGWMYESL